VGDRLQVWVSELRPKGVILATNPKKARRVTPAHLIIPKFLWDVGEMEDNLNASSFILMYSFRDCHGRTMNRFVCDKVMSLKALGPAASLKARIDRTDRARPCKSSNVQQAEKRLPELENHVINHK